MKEQPTQKAIQPPPPTEEEFTDQIIELAHELSSPALRRIAAELLLNLCFRMSGDQIDSVRDTYPIGGQTLMGATIEELKRTLNDQCPRDIAVDKTRPRALTSQG